MLFYSLAGKCHGPRPFLEEASTPFMPGLDPTAERVAASSPCLPPDTTEARYCKAQECSASESLSSERTEQGAMNGLRMQHGKFGY